MTQLEQVLFMPKRSAIIKTALRWAVAIILLGLLGTQVPWESVWATMRETPLWVLGAGVGLFVVVRWVMAVQMRLLLPQNR